MSAGEAVGTVLMRLTADVVLFAPGEDGRLHVLLIRRGWDPFAGRWALPGGHVDPGEDTESAARRELAEETGLHAGALTQVGVYATPGRDPRGRYVTFAYTATLPCMAAPAAGDDATEARWWPVAALSESDDLLAFDHARIVADAAALIRDHQPHGELTPAQQQAEFLTALAGHLRANPHLAPVSVNPHRHVQVWTLADGTQDAAKLVDWFRSVAAAHLVVGLQDDYATVGAHRVPMGQASVRVWGAVSDMQKLLVQGGYPATVDGGLPLTIADLGHFAEHGTLPGRGEPR